MIYFNQNKEACSFVIDDALCVVEDVIWQEFSILKLGEEYDITSEGIVDLRQTEEYKERQAQAERERIQELSMTRSDFFDGTIKAFGADADDLLVAIQTVLAGVPMDDIEKKVAINNYKNALNFYRKHPLFTMLSNVPIPVAEGVVITITAEQWDMFFDETDKDNPYAYTYLQPLTPQEPPVEEPENEGTENTTEQSESEQSTDGGKSEQPTDIQV